MRPVQRRAFPAVMRPASSGSRTRAEAAQKRHDTRQKNIPIIANTINAPITILPNLDMAGIGGFAFDAFGCG
jgi:hypothetical protein